MAADKSIFTIPLSRWNWDGVDSFLSLRVPENESVEYKAAFDDSLPDTMAAMANGSGGYIFIGVAEKGDKRPSAWPLLDGKDRSESAYSHAASNTEPIVQIDARAIFKRDSAMESDAKSDPPDDRHNQVVVIHVPSGSYPPYYSRNKGVRVRVGDADAHATPRTLEMLFARRQRADALHVEHRDRIPDCKRGYLIIDEDAPAEPARFSLLVVPLYGGVPLRLGDGLSRIAAEEIRKLAWLGFKPEESRSDQSFAFESDGDKVEVHANGDITYELAFYENVQSQTAARQIKMRALVNHVLVFLEFAEGIYLRAAEYAGDLYVGFRARDMAGKSFSWPDSPWGDNPRRPTNSREFNSCLFDLDYRMGSGAIFPTRRLMSFFCWRQGLDGAEEILGTWGRDLEKSRR